MAELSMVHELYETMVEEDEERAYYTEGSTPMSRMLDHAANIDALDFHYWLDTLTPDNIMRVELHLRREGMTERADIAERAGVANCGDEYYNQ